MRQLPGLEIDGPDDHGVVVVRLASGLPGNRMTADLHRSLARLWPALGDLPEARCVLVRGTGGDLCGGAEASLAARAVHAGGDERAHILDEARAIVVGLLDCELPIVCALEGRAYGAPLALALLADICVAAEDAELADGHARLEVVAGDHAVLVWPMLMGMAQAKRHLLLPERISGRRAHELGMVAELAPPGAVLESATGFARRLAAASPWAVRWTKRALHHAYRQALPAFDASLAHEMVSYATAAAADAVAGLAPAAEKGAR